LPRLHGEVFGQHNPIGVASKWEFLFKQSSPLNNFRIIRLGFGLDLP
jgi:hypothetical protein